MLKERIAKIIEENGVKSMRQLSEILGVNYDVFHRNIKENKITGDIVMAFAQSQRIKCDLNFLLRDDFRMEEPSATYELSNDRKLDIAIRLIEEVKSKL